MSRLQTKEHPVRKKVKKKKEEETIIRTWYEQDETQKQTFCFCQQHGWCSR